LCCWRSVRGYEGIGQEDKEKLKRVEEGLVGLKEREIYRASTSEQALVVLSRYVLIMSAVGEIYVF